MSRPGDITGKTVTARLPMEDYIKVLQSATGQNLSVSEYVLLKLFTDDREAALKAEIEQLKTSLAQEAEFSEQYKKVSADNLEIAKKAAADLKKAIDEKQKLQKELTEATDMLNLLTDEGGKEIDKKDNELKQLRSELLKYKTANDAWSKEAEREKAEKAKAIQGIKDRALVAENLWKTFHKKNGSVPEWIDVELKKISRY